MSEQIMGNVTFSNNSSAGDINWDWYINPKDNQSNYIIYKGNTVDPNSISIGGGSETFKFPIQVWKEGDLRLVEETGEIQRFQMGQWITIGHSAELPQREDEPQNNDDDFELGGAL